MSTVAAEIRTLIRQIEELARSSPVNSATYKITANCCDHLAALARISEINHGGEVVKHPMQPITVVRGIARFYQNNIVRYLLDAGVFDMNHLATLPFSEDDWTQFAQLIGYSVSGFGDLSYVDPEAVAEADRKVEEML